MNPAEVAGLASTRTYPLRSSFRPSYNMAVNLVERLGVVVDPYVRDGAPPLAARRGDERTRLTLDLPLSAADAADHAVTFASKSLSTPAKNAIAMPAIAPPAM